MSSKGYSKLSWNFEKDTYSTGDKVKLIWNLDNTRWSIWC